ncbi:MAG: substrate-binding domain-containing protein, partial [Anaerolineae bacterium]|nr:substrate-binding domain-containing protein [Anaerolineae bacterium]
LVGFDDLDVVAHLDVPLTTVAQDAFQIGQLAAELLVRRLRGEATGTQRHVVPTSLVVRRSCGFSV